MAAEQLESRGGLGVWGRGGLGEAHPAGAPGRVSVVVLATLACVCSSVDVWVLMTMALPLLEPLNPAAVTIQAIVAAAGLSLIHI